MIIKAIVKKSELEEMCITENELAASLDDSLCSWDDYMCHGVEVEVVDD